MAFKKLKDIKPIILDSIYALIRPTKIPQYIVKGTDCFREICQGAANTNGKGHSKEQALASGIMEFAERYSCYKFLLNKRNIKLASFNEIKQDLWKKEDVYANHGEDFYMQPVIDKKISDIKIRWFTAYTLSGQVLYLPTYLLVNLLEGTNGWAAGNSFEEALLQGICEVIERHCKCLIEINKLKAPLIDMSTIKSAIARRLIRLFHSQGHEVYIKDFSLG